MKLLFQIHKTCGYGIKSGLGAYEVKTLADAMVIAPAQGFFVQANAAGGTFNFAESNQAGSGGTLSKN